MSEEEREVLKTFKKGLGLTSAEQEILVNYIDRLQKELEQAKKQLDLDYVDNNFVSKDKIKDKIKELENNIENLTHFNNNEVWGKDILENISAKAVLEDLLEGE